MTVDTEVLEACADILDQASNVTLASTANQIAHYSYLAAPEQIQNEDGTWPVTECTSCGNDIEVGRVALGRVRCLRCQEILERKTSGYFTNPYEK